MVLTIKPLQVDDSGNYTLVGFNDNGNQASISVILNVKGKPKVSIKSEKDFFKFRHNYTLNCEVNGFPFSTIKWFYYSCHNERSFKCRPNLANYSSWEELTNQHANQSIILSKTNHELIREQLYDETRAITSSHLDFLVGISLRSST